MSATCKPPPIPYILNTSGDKPVKFINKQDIEWDRNDINSYIETYIRKLENGEKVDDANLAVQYKSHYDDSFENTRTYYFEYQKYGQTNNYATIRPIPESNTQKCIDYILEKDELPKPPPTRLVPEYGDTHLFGDLINWLFPKCEYCNKRHIRYLFKLHYNDIHICKRCGWIYEIDSIEKYNIVNKIREEVKKNVNLQSFCNMQFEENESISEKMEVISC